MQLCACPYKGFYVAMLLPPRFVINVFGTYLRNDDQIGRGLLFGRKKKQVGGIVLQVEFFRKSQE